LSLGSPTQRVDPDSQGPVLFDLGSTIMKGPIKLKENGALHRGYLRDYNLFIVVDILE
jgi:hypothetical protein